MDSLGNVLLFLRSCAAFYTLDIKTRNIYINKPFLRVSMTTRSLKSVLEEGALPDSCSDLDFWPYCYVYPATLHLHCHTSSLSHSSGSFLWSCQHKWMYLYLRLLYLWWFFCSQNPDQIRKWRDINGTLISWSSLFSGYFQP